MANGIAEFICERPNWFDLKLWQKGEILKCPEENADKIPHHFTRIDNPEENPSTINVDEELGKLTNRQLKSILDAKEIDYPGNANRSTLLGLVELVKEGVEIPEGE